MKQVNIYTYSTAKSPKPAKTQCEAVGYIVAFETSKGTADVGKIEAIHEMTKFQSELYVLKNALARINTMCELNIYTESDYVAAGFEKWLEQWKTKNWKTKAGKEVSNKKEWMELDALVQQYGHKITFHVKEHHSYREWLRDNVEKEKTRCLKDLENLTARKR